jgi:hypothetical protein
VKQRGRPKNLENLNLITLDDAVELIREFWKMDKAPISRRTLQNKISKGEINRYGPYKHTLLDRDEVINKLCRSKAS